MAFLEKWPGLRYIMGCVEWKENEKTETRLLPIPCLLAFNQRLVDLNSDDKQHLHS